MHVCVQEMVQHMNIYMSIYRSVVSRFHSDSAQHVGVEHMIQLMIRNFQDTSALYLTDLFHGDR